MIHFQFGDFQFDPQSGALTRGGVSAGRLPPQPAQVLTLLLKQAPNIVPHTVIQAQVWPDVEVEFEQSLHHCIRQIRNALGDAAASPRYIRTVHRRGYQFIANVEPVTDDAPSNLGETAQAEIPSSLHQRGQKAWISGLVVVMLAALLITWLHRDPSPTRVAIMTFAPLDKVRAGTPIAERLIVMLTQHPDAFEVIGPTTTATYEGQPEGLITLLADLNVDYILNGRFPADTMETRFLAEIIRATDGAHVWVQYFDEADADSLVAVTIADAFMAYQASQP